MQGVTFLASLGTLFLLLDTAHHVQGFSAGVPPLRSVCSDMLPHHHEYKPQASQAPYEILTSATTVAGGGDITVTLKSTQPGTLFRGFYMQARDENSKPIGTFTGNDDAKTHSCGGVRSNTAHHANGKIEKQMASLTWTAPKDYVGEVIFISTFVKDFVNIWAGVYSEPVTVTAFVKKSRDGILGNASNDGGLLGLVSSLGIYIPGITPENNPNNKPNNANAPARKK